MSALELKPIYVQVTLFHINEVDMNNESFKSKFDLSVWWNKSYGKKTKSNFEPVIRFPNAIHYEEQFRYQLPPVYSSDKTLVGYRATYEGKFRSEMDLKRFPFDEQYFRISLLLGRDKETGKDLTIQDGFILTHTESANSFVVNPNTSEYKFGIIENRTSDFSVALSQNDPSSKYVVLIPAKRKYQYYLLNHYSFVFLIFIMSFSIFLLDSPTSSININQSANRMALTLSLFLSLVAYKFALSTSLPPIKYLTHFDKYNLLCFLCLVSQFIFQGICFQFFNGNSHALNICALTIAVITVIGHLYLVYDASTVIRPGHMMCCYDGHPSCPRLSLRELFDFRDRRSRQTYQPIIGEFEDTKEANSVDGCTHASNIVSDSARSSNTILDPNRECFSTVNLSPKGYRGFDNYGQI